MFTTAPFGWRKKMNKQVYSKKERRHTFQGFPFIFCFHLYLSVQMYACCLNLKLLTHIITIFFITAAIMTEAENIDDGNLAAKISKP